MNFILHIGARDAEGRFTGKAWDTLVAWLSARTSRLYTMSEVRPEGSLPDWRVVEVNYLGPDGSNYFLEPNDALAWDSLKSAQFSADEPISNIHLLRGGDLLASLIVDDGDNFVVLWDIDPTELGPHFGVASSDDAFFSGWSAHCSSLVEGQPWEGVYPS